MVGVLVGNGVWVDIGGGTGVSVGVADGGLDVAVADSVLVVSVDVSCGFAAGRGFDVGVLVLMITMAVGAGVCDVSVMVKGFASSS